MKIMYVFLLSVVVQSVFAMEKQVPCTVIETIENIMPDVAQPMSIGYVRKGVIAASGSKEFIIRDIKNEQSIMVRKARHKGSYLNAHFTVNNPGTKVALFYHVVGVLRVYDAITGKIELERVLHNDFKNIYFNQENSNQIICCNGVFGHIVQCDTVKDSILQRFTQSPEEYVFAHHSKQTKIFISSLGTSFWVFDYVALSNKQQLFSRIFTTDDCVLEQCYSPDGTVVALRAQTTSTTTIALLYVDGGNKIEYLSSSMDMTFNTLYQSMLFHPNNNILFLLDKKNTIECWDFKNKKCIHAIHFSNQPYLLDHNSKRLACSASGKKLFVALQNQCAMVHVPLNVLYAPDTIKNMIFITFALQEYDSKRIVKDVQYVILKKLLKLYRNEK